MKNKSFTLIEITIVVTIIALLATVFIANYRGGERQFALKRSAHKLSQDLRGAQEMAMSSQITPLEFGPETFPKGGYGIYFEEGASSYVLFADCDGDGLYDVSGGSLSCKDATEVTPYPEKIREIFFEEGISIDSLFPASPNVSITFFPPDPVLTVKYDTSTSTSASITLTFDGQSRKTVSINSVGLIDID